MKRFIIKHRKGLSIWAAILFLPAAYLMSILSIHIQNNRCNKTYNKLIDSADGNGLLVPKFGPRPADLKNARGNFYEGLAIQDSELLGLIEYIKPDGSIAFRVNADYADPFFNSRAVLREELPSRGYPRFREAVIDNTGKHITGFRYYQIKDYVGEKGNEYSMVTSPTIYYPIFEILMDGIDIHIPPFEFFFPPVKASFLDKNGNHVSLREVIQSIKRLEEQAVLKNSQ